MNMPKCAVCGKHFPSKLKIEGKVRVLRSRKRCLECSPFGKHNTTPINKRKDRRCIVKPTGAVCKQCERSFDSKKIRGSCCNACWVNRRRYKIKLQAIEYKGGKCGQCGYNKCPSALTFHHRDPKEKKFNISGSHARAWNKIQLELDKCDLLCRNCHAEIEYQYSYYTAPVG
jgi:hypothetical protein